MSTLNNLLGGGLGLGLGQEGASLCVLLVLTRILNSSTSCFALLFLLVVSRHQETSIRKTEFLLAFKPSLD